MMKQTDLNKVRLMLVNIVKIYPGTIANNNVNLKVREGEVHALLGENGAGKSTLMNILYGLTEPNEGDIVFEGTQVHIQSPKDAIATGIGMVHQHFMLIPALTVVENIILGMDDTRKVALDTKGVADRILELSKKYNLAVDPYARISDLTVGQQQRVEIVKALYKECRLLILDEPTAVLTPQEIEQLFLIIRQLKAENKSVIFITHKLGEVMAVCDRITVLRAGETVGTVKTSETNPRELAQMMVGKEVLFEVDKKDSAQGEVVLDVEHLTVRNKDVPAVSDLSLRVHAGEIYGIAGVDGNGQSELVRAITALKKKTGGTVTICGRDVTKGSSRDVLDCQVAHIPEDRQNVGVVMGMSIKENMLLHDYKKKEYKKNGLLDWKRIAAHAQELIQKYNIKTPGEEEPITALSGGNQQKVVVARELETHPKLMLAVHPTRGVDVGAIEFIHKQIVAARDEGCAVLLISTELDEILSLSDRIGVIYEGKILGEMAREEAEIGRIGLLMAGHCETASA